MLLAVMLPIILPVQASDWPQGWQQARLPETLQFDVTSRHTGSTYRILIGLPHATAPTSGYPVLWMLDGAASYPITQFVRPRADDAGQGSRREISRAARPAGLVVAITYANDKSFDVDSRARDYTPKPDADTGDRLSPEFGGAASFRRFLVDELRPLIGKHFPLDPQRNTLFGFSYGGLFTVDTLLNEPQAFQRYWAASPSLWFSDAQVMRRLADSTKLPDTAGVQRIMLTVGRDEQYPAATTTEERQAHLNRRAMVEHLNRAANLLVEANPGVQVSRVVAVDQDHFDMLLHGARRVIDFAFAP